MRIFAFISLINSVVIILFAQAIYLRNKSDPVNRSFALVCLTLGVWSFGQFMQRNATSLVVADFWIRIMALAWPLTAPFFLYFIIFYTGKGEILRHKWVTVAIFLPGVLTVITDSTTKLITAGPLKVWWGFTYANPKDETYYLLANGWLLLTFAFTMILLGRFYLKTGDSNKKYQTKLIFISALALGLIAAISDVMLPILDIRVPELATSYLIIMTLMVGYAISKYELFSLNPTETARNVIATMNDSLLLLDPEGTVITVNQAALNLLGYKKSELLGHSAQIVFADHDLWAEIMAKSRLLDWSTRNLETSYVTKRGRAVPVLFSGALIKDGKGKSGGMVCVAKDITSLKKAEETIKYMAFHDALTGLPNRILFMSRLHKALQHANFDTQESALLFLDLDKFKKVNDELGHDIGDLLLKNVGRRLSASVRESDTVSRAGGDEFNILLVRIGRKEDSAEIAKNILANIARPFSLKGNRVSITACIGINTTSFAGSRPDDIIGGAEIAMRAAKQAGSNNYVFFKPGMRVNGNRRRKAA